jgi:hypothetical protein
MQDHSSVTKKKKKKPSDQITQVTQVPN